MSVRTILEKYIEVGEHIEWEVVHDGADPWGVHLKIPNDLRDTSVTLTGHPTRARAIESRNRIIDVLELVFQDVIEDVGLTKKEP